MAVLSRASRCTRAWSVGGSALLLALPAREPHALPRPQTRTTAQSAAPTFPLGGVAWLVLVLAALWAGWLLAIHLFLWTPLLRSLLRTQNVWLSYSSAWSVWPGTVHLRGVALAVEDSYVNLRITIDALAVSVAVTELPWRMFHCTDVYARGVTLRLKWRVRQSEATPEAIAGLPPIEWLNPVRSDAPDVEVPDSEYQTFSV